jgi:hypothetical protein
MTVPLQQRIEKEKVAISDCSPVPGWKHEVLRRTDEYPILEDGRCESQEHLLRRYEFVDTG